MLPTPSENADFDRFRLMVPQPRKLAKNAQLPLIRSRQCAFHRAIDKPCIRYPLSPQGVSQSDNFLRTLRCFVVGNRRHFKFGMPIDHSKSQHTDDKLSLKWAWSRHVIHVKFQGPKHTS